MKTVLLVLVVASLLTISFSQELNSENEVQVVLNEFKEFISKHDKQYDNAHELLKRLSIFSENREFVVRHNKKPTRTYDVDINMFADMTNEEFQEYNGILLVPNKKEYELHKSNNTLLPSAVDWRASGLVTNVKNQGQCGSCWAFSAVASLEGQHAKKTGKLVSLSEQNLVDCAGKFGCQGCEGGWMASALEYVEYNGGLDTEASYPYKAVDESCVYRSSHRGATVKNVVNITKGNSSDLLHAIATVGPISVAIDASDRGFQMYDKGVYTSKSCSKEFLDHGVTAVGYGVTDKNLKYYIIKNSWGATWGMNGYMYFNRDQDGGNMCGVAQAASYPVV